MIISSDPIKIDLNTGGTKELDLDGDGIYETKIALEGTTDNIAQVKILVNGGSLKSFLKKDAISKFTINSSTVKVTLNPYENRVLDINIFADKPGLYVGNLILRSDTIEKLIPVTIEIQSKRVLLNINLDIPEEFKEVLKGDKLKAQITMFKTLDKELVKVKVNYMIKDINGNDVLTESEYTVIGDQNSFVKEFDLPDTIKEGAYVLGAEVLYKDSFSVSSDSFNVKEEKKVRYGYITLAIIFFILMYATIRWLHKVK